MKVAVDTVGGHKVYTFTADQVDIGDGHILYGFVASVTIRGFMYHIGVRHANTIIEGVAETRRYEFEGKRVGKSDAVLEDELTNALIYLSTALCRVLKGGAFKMSGGFFEAVSKYLADNIEIDTLEENVPGVVEVNGDVVSGIAALIKLFAVMDNYGGVNSEN